MKLTRISEKIGAIALAVVLSTGAASAATCMTPQGIDLALEPTFMTGSNVSGAECYAGNDAQNTGGPSGVRKINADMAFGFDDWMLAFKNDNGDGDGNITFGSGPVNGTMGGTWSIVNSMNFALSNILVVLKSANGYGAFDISDTSGTWSSSQALSHASIWYRGNPGDNNNMSPVPVPAAGFLLIGGLGGLAALRRRRKKS